MQERNHCFQRRLIMRPKRSPKVWPKGHHFFCQKDNKSRAQRCAEMGPKGPPKLRQKLRQNRSTSLYRKQPNAIQNGNENSEHDANPNSKWNHRSFQQITSCRRPFRAGLRNLKTWAWKPHGISLRQKASKPFKNELLEAFRKGLRNLQFCLRQTWWNSNHGLK